MNTYTKSIIKNSKLVKQSKVFILSRPSKISKTKNCSFSVPAGPKFSCPGATSACKDCYAQKGRHFCPSVQNTLISNWKNIKKYEGKNNDKIVQMLSYSISASRSPIFRIYESGDFHSQHMVDIWNEVVKMHPDVLFWAYTRSFDFNFKKILKNKNFVLWASADECNEQVALKFAKSNKIKNAFGPYSKDKKIPKDSFACPVTSGKMQIEGACEKCKLCLKKDSKKHVVFFKH